MSTAGLILLPGVGADERLFAPQREAFPQLIIPPWIPPQQRESLPHYAARMAESIDCRPPLVLGGVSLGGMVAYEMARQLRPQRLLLIASCRSRQAIRGPFRPLGPIARRLPAATVDAARLFSPLAYLLLPHLTVPQRKLCVSMFQAADSHFVQWALGAILAWDPQPLEGIDIAAIHGARDPLIPATRVAADVVIAGGGHLINLTHADDVNAFIAKAIAAAAASVGR